MAKTAKKLDPVETPEKNEIIMHTASGVRVNFRREACMNDNVICVLDSNTAVTVIGEEDKFYKVSVHGTEGYISKAYLV